MNWRVKGAVQKVLGVVPAGNRLHFLLQRHLGELRHLSKELTTKFDDWTLMVKHLRDAKVFIAGSRFVEMGTGWYPTFPMCLYLGGAARVDSIDLNRHLRRDLTLEAATLLESRLPAIGEYAGRPVADVAAAHRELLRVLRDGADIETATRGVVRYRAPGDAAATGLPPESVDVVFSNSVLEHVPAEVIGRCFAEAVRILRPGGVVFHSVNCGDHYAYVDRSISQLNYLRYSADDWSKWNNRFLYQNRLRANDFIDLAQRAGFTIELDASPACRLAQLAEIDVHPSFARYSEAQLATTSLDFIGRRT